MLQRAGGRAAAVFTHFDVIGTWFPVSMNIDVLLEREAESIRYQLRSFMDASPSLWLSWIQVDGTRFSEPSVCCQQAEGIPD
jgi:hypothetical protein